MPAQRGRGRREGAPREGLRGRQGGSEEPRTCRFRRGMGCAAGRAPWHQGLALRAGSEPRFLPAAPRAKQGAPNPGGAQAQQGESRRPRAKWSHWEPQGRSAAQGDFPSVGGASTAPRVQKEEGIGAKQTGRAAKATRFTWKAVSLETTVAKRRGRTARPQPTQPGGQQEGTGQRSQKARGEPPAQGQAKEASREDPKAWDYNPSTSGVRFRGQRGHEDKQDLLSPARQRYTGPSHATGSHRRGRGAARGLTGTAGRGGLHGTPVPVGRCSRHGAKRSQSHSRCHRQTHIPKRPLELAGAACSTSPCPHRYSHPQKGPRTIPAPCKPKSAPAAHHAPTGPDQPDPVLQ